ncbi:CinA family protein [Leifsonia sp. H3M29-4]|uniref:CinA family protein n=1 Tax=Salinibacterium metalliresistens TaxID=3031321 RepID=UPI0023DC0CE7|nr:CinA family protein [Salinibacterium metalliresistens]MDF1478968.1 CinA family protein [Salinibacterium metalliresistens]
MADAAASIIATLTARHWSIGVAESLTGGLLTAELVSIPGASAVVRGGVVAYDTSIKHSVLGVDAEVLAAHGAVHADVAAQMASGVRAVLAVDGRPAHVGVSATGVAGPDPQDGQPIGTVYLGFAIGSEVRTTHLQLTGSRAEIRAAVVDAALTELLDLLEP